MGNSCIHLHPLHLHSHHNNLTIYSLRSLIKVHAHQKMERVIKFISYVSVSPTTTHSMGAHVTRSSNTGVSQMKHQILPPHEVSVIPFNFLFPPTLLDRRIKLLYTWLVLDRRWLVEVGDGIQCDGDYATQLP